ncbi:MAG TPA: APC family permease [Chloroflexota bacterium]|nr:APC family permease [Chloroflexota bacterium]
MDSTPDALGRIPDEGRTTPALDTALPRLRPGALNLFETISGTLANLAPAEGIFLSITLVVAAMGSRSPWAFLIAGIAILAAGNTMAEFAKVMPSAGSFVTFIANGFGATSRRNGTFLAGVAFYLLLLCYPITVAAVVAFLGSWVASLFNWTQPWVWLLITLLAVAVSTPLLLRGVVISTVVSFILFCSEVLGLLVLSIGVFILAGSHLSAPLHDVGGSPGGFQGLVGVTFALAVSGYIGWENSGPLAEEAEHPQRAIPLTIFISIAIIALIYLISSWGAVAGFAAWKGGAKGVNFLGSFSEAAPYLDLAKHYLPWFAWFIGLIGYTSSQACYLAAANSQTRIIFNGAREGLLPSWAAAVTPKTRVPWVAVTIYLVLTAVIVLIGYVALKGNAVSVFSDEAGIGTVPILFVYLLANIALIIYMLRARRDLFNPFQHLIVPIIGILVLGYGIYEFVQPNQPAPGNIFWIYILLLLVIAVVGTLIAMTRNPRAIEHVGTVLAE